MLKKQKTKIAFFLLCTVYFQIACTANKFRQPISKFQAAAALVTANARESLSEMNRLEIARVITIKRLGGQKITGDDIEKAKKISFENLQIRLAALDRINEYADLLVAIANSDAPDNIAKSATDLNTSITQLTYTVMNLTGAKNADFKSKFNIAATIISEILRAFAQKKIKEALEKSIMQSSSPIENLIDAIGEDLTVAYIVKDSGFKDLEQELIERYEEETLKTSPNEATLDTLANKIKSNREIIELMPLANPQDSLTQMKKTHTKLVKYAKEKTPQNFEDVVNEIENFAAISRRLGEAVQELRKRNI